MIPSYTKVLTIGSAFTENALVGEVVIQEKVDGSQFRFGINEDGELVCGSKSARIDFDGPPKMFKRGTDYLLSIKEKLLKYPKNTYFYGEYLEKPKHNVLKYKDTPKNNIVLFDVLLEGTFVQREGLDKIAEDLDIDLIPELYRGLADINYIKSIIVDNIPASYLGNEKIEGVVIKNYKETILLGGQVFPLFTKYVREAFKERHTTEWKIKKPKDSINFYIQSFKSDARWQKAYQYLKDQNKLENQPKDIATLIKRVNQDITEEETENIKNDLFKIAFPEIIRVATHGLPEWYKAKLLENVK